MYQRTEIIGRLGRDVEMRYLTDGTAVASFSVATDKTWKNANGQKQSKTTWFRVSAFGLLAETCNQYLSKGRLVQVEGEMQEARPYQGRDGEWRASLDLRANRVLFLGGGNSEQAEPQAEPQRAQADDGPPMYGLEEEIPF